MRTTGSAGGDRFTDSGISRARNGQAAAVERELQPFFEGDEPAVTEVAIEEESVGQNPPLLKFNHFLMKKK